MGILDDVIDFGNKSGGGIIEFVMQFWWVVLIGLGVVSYLVMTRF